MAGSIITSFQLFGIGVALGLSSQCLFACAPILLSYTAAAERDWKRSFLDVVLLIAGRVVAYVILGALVAVSISYIERAASSRTVAVVRAVAGALIIALGLATILGIGFKIGACERLAHRGFSRGGLFAAGLAIGFAPCLPLISVLSEISLISKTAVSGALYALAFALGTAFASLVTVGPVAAILGHLPSRIIKSERVQRSFRVICGMLLVLFGVIFFLSSSANAQDKALFVRRVVDGDTLELSDRTRVRLIGIDTPEYHYSKKLLRDSKRSARDIKAIQAMGREAMNFTKRISLGRRVRLEYDVERLDRYGRSLAYVWLDDGTFLNAEIIKAGYASTMTIAPNVKHASLFVNLEKEAREKGRGLWKAE